MPPMQYPVADSIGPVLLQFLDRSRLRFEFWDGSHLGSIDSKATIRFNGPDAIRRIIGAPGELGIARAFVSGDIDIVGDGFEALSILTRIRPEPSRIGFRTLTDALRQLRTHGALGRNTEVPAEEARPKGRKHSLRRDSASISHHYDVGNDFYRLVLGESMTYSCARFVDAYESLEDAQTSKYDLICRKLGLVEGMRLLDVGCGWGGMVLHAAARYGVTAVGITLSNNQARLARERVAEAGLQDRIEIRVQDYRDLRNETFDAVSSIGMFEHVGRSKMSEYFSTLRSVLVPGGRLLNHAIDSVGGSYMPSDGFVARYVFPDGELQDLSTSLAAMQDAGFEVRDVESLREHYAKTLRCWVGNLEDDWDEAVRLVGHSRARIWWIYMIGSAVSFEANRISIHQTIAVNTSTEGTSSMPLTRSEFV